MGDDELKARLAIDHLLATCAQAGDARKAEVYAGCFAPDGVLELTGQSHAGREAIRQWMAAPSAIPQSKHRPAGFVSHHITTSRIDLTGPGFTTANGRIYWLVTSPAGIDHNGYYDDSYVQIGGSWLIAHRRPRTLWIAPDSLIHGSR